MEIGQAWLADGRALAKGRGVRGRGLEVESVISAYEPLLVRIRGDGMGSSSSWGELAGHPADLGWVARVSR